MSLIGCGGVVVVVVVCFWSVYEFIFVLLLVVEGGESVV